MVTLKELGAPIFHFKRKKNTIIKPLEEVVGITSRVLSGKINKKNQCIGHWLLFDVDNSQIADAARCLRWIKQNFKDFIPLRFYTTPHGFHFILFTRRTLKQAYEILKLCPYTDKKWVERGFKRKYWFLDTHGKRDFPKRVEYMKIKRAVKVAEEIP